ncbi:hypothetical protein NDU88_003506 [Pleurodeles waltl]|uniref:Uncharacterized protein n=1 Tax=Pleurodeles waltl TaxID=8319 RepID=A0AAV7NR24_PLEWA|nr:hypothetical protein NDU88_003506 [Pleurodeles waltl]
MQVAKPGGAAGRRALKLFRDIRVNLQLDGDNCVLKGATYCSPLGSIVKEPYWLLRATLVDWIPFQGLPLENQNGEGNLGRCVKNNSLPLTPERNLRPDGRVHFDPSASSFTQRCLETA